MDYEEAEQFLLEDGIKIGDAFYLYGEGVKQYIVDEIIIAPKNNWKSVITERAMVIGDNKLALNRLGLINEALEVLLIANIVDNPFHTSLKDYRRWSNPSDI